ncbi:MAG: TetR/AcrR family transcriptional regulator [Gammaproteobacteria bacterium]|jgi:TetR/AcrR family transcriptional regulator, copper-responsive repressor
MGAGRQRSFDKEEALIKAMEVFWRKGYSGTSLSDLTGAMGINKPSLYAAFGNKEKLFISAINHYVDQYGAPHFDKLLGPDASLRERVRAYLQSIARMLSDSSLPGGCFVASSTCEVAGDCLPADAVQTVLSINRASTEAFVSFFRDEQAKGHIESTTSPEVLADYLLTLQFGLAVMARDGIEEERLDEVIRHAVETL